MSDPPARPPNEPTPAFGPLPEYAVDGDPRAAQSREALDLADSAGVRVLMAGGVAYVQLGLISPRQSLALSLIVDPEGVDALLTALGRAGWQRLPGAPDPLLPAAVITLQHRASGARLDLYPLIPGFVHHPSSVFAQLWACGGPIRAFGREVMAVDRLSMMMLAVHSRLGPRSGGPGLEEYTDFFFQQFAVVITDDERERLPLLVRAVGGQAVMRPFLERLGLPSGQARLPSAAYTEARFGMAGLGTAARVFIGVWDAPVGQRRRVARDTRRASRWVGAHLLTAAPALMRQLPQARRARRSRVERALAGG
ncbi:hypothetical protein [Microcella sp.]|uniref:hypothetical protein n=1 Tax=Microcella sp. TaxID=1913979 RepID=UPI0025631907|nr:hypothetical protein [Microcella sp.]MBX9471947.1 hypothetical protein [Microcella sp.]